MVAPPTAGQRIEQLFQKLADTQGTPNTASNIPRPLPVAYGGSSRTSVSTKHGGGIQTSSGSQSSQGSQGPMLHSNPVGTASSPNQMHNSWVLLVVRSRNQFKLTQINVESLTTDMFFKQLHSDYFRLRGRLVNYFSVWCYSHCDFYKVRRGRDLHIRTVGRIIN